MKRALTGIASEGHVGSDRWGGDGECSALSALRPCANLYPAGLSTPKPRDFNVSHTVGGA
jgi:hypothetical protein